MYASSSGEGGEKAEGTKEYVNKSSADIAKQYSGLLDVLQQQYYSRQQDHNHHSKGNSQDSHYQQQHQDCQSQREQQQQPPILISRQKLKYNDENNDKDQQNQKPNENYYFDNSWNAPQKHNSNNESLLNQRFNSRTQQFQQNNKPSKLAFQLRSYSYFPHSKLSTFEDQSQQSSKSEDQNDQVAMKESSRNSKSNERDHRPHLKSKLTSNDILETQRDMKKTIDLRRIQESMSTSQDPNSHRIFHSQEEESSIQQLGTFRESLWKPSINSNTSRSNKNASTSLASAEKSNASKNNYDTFQEPQGKQECSYHYRKDTAQIGTKIIASAGTPPNNRSKQQQHKNHNLIPTSKISHFVGTQEQQQQLQQPEASHIRASFNIINASLRPPKWEGGANKENKENERDFRNCPWKESKTNGKAQQTSGVSGNHISLKSQPSRHQHQSYASLDQSDSVVLFENSFSEIMDPHFESTSQPENTIENQEISTHKPNQHYPQEWLQNYQKQQQGHLLSRGSQSVNRNTNINSNRDNNTKQQQQQGTLFKNESSLSTTLASSFSQTINHPLGLSSQRSQLLSVAAFSPFDYCNSSIPQGDHCHPMFSKAQGSSLPSLSNKLLGMSSNSLVNYEDSHNYYDNHSHNLHSNVNSNTGINLSASPVHQSGHFLQPHTELEFLLATEKAQQHNEVKGNECDIARDVALTSELVNFCSFAEVKRKLEMSISEENVVSDEKMRHEDDAPGRFWRRDLDRQIKRHSYSGQLNEKIAVSVQKAVLKVIAVMRKSSERLLSLSFKRLRLLQCQQSQAHDQGQIFNFYEHVTEESKESCHFGKNKMNFQQYNQQVLIKKLTGILQLSIKLRDIAVNRLQTGMSKINKQSMRRIILNERNNNNMIQNQPIRVALGLVSTFNKMISSRDQTNINQAQTSARILTRVLATRFRKDAFSKWKSLILQRHNCSKVSGINSKYVSKSPKYNIYSFCESHSDNNNLWSFNANSCNQLEFQENQKSLNSNQRQMISFENQQNKSQASHNVMRNTYQNHSQVANVRSNFSKERTLSKEDKDKDLIVPPAYWHSSSNRRAKSADEDRRIRDNKTITNKTVVETKVAKFSPSFRKHQQK